MDWGSVNNQFWNEYSAKNVLCDACRGQLKVASKELKAERRALCAICEQRNRYGFCMKCGCKTDWKTAFTKSKCPLDLW